jgi:hypothetical protein
LDLKIIPVIRKQMVAKSPEMCIARKKPSELSLLTFSPVFILIKAAIILAVCQTILTPRSDLRAKIQI